MDSNSSIEGTILTLKRKALACKQLNDIDTAKQWLTQAKTIERLHASKDAIDQKTLAQLLQQLGDVNGAKQALLRHQQLGKNVTQKQQQHDDCQRTNESNFNEISTNIQVGNVCFTDEELLDVETLADMRSAGMLDTLGRTDYEHRIDECKRDALQAKKQGDLMKAETFLLRSKQLSQAMETLFCDKNTKDTIGKDNFDDNNDNDLDYSLLDELINDDGGAGRNFQGEGVDGFMEQLFGKSSTVIELDDLADMDADMLRDAIQAGMSVPDLEEIRRTVQNKKKMAVTLKKSGDIVAAKTVLEEAKLMECGASRLSEMLQSIENGECDKQGQQDDPDNVLESMLETASDKPALTTVAAPVVSTKHLLPSHEYKVQAIAFKREGRIPEATAALRLYKQVLAAETSAKVTAQREKYVVQLRDEMHFAQDQSRMFAFYEHFVDEVRGHAYSLAWQTYTRDCAKLIEHVLTMETEVPDELERKSTSSNLRMICESDLGFVGKTVDPAEERIEVCIMACMNLQDNKYLREKLGITIDFKGDVEMPPCGMIRVIVTSPLPASMEYPDDNVHLHFEPQKRIDNREYLFQGSQFLNAEHGSSRFANLLVRRIARKRLTVDVIFVVVKKGIFSSNFEETLLGTAVIELKDLLQNNVVAGDYPLLDTMRRHHVGGQLRLVLRTGRPFGQVKMVKSDDMTASTGLGTTTIDIKSFAPYVLPMD